MTPRYNDDFDRARAEFLASIDLGALLEKIGRTRDLIAKHTHRAHPEYPCPNRHHKQTNATPPAFITRAPEGYELWHCFRVRKGRHRGARVDLRRSGSGCSGSPRKARATEWAESPARTATPRVIADAECDYALAGPASVARTDG
jgi:hypothetical protein